MKGQKVTLAAPTQDAPVMDLMAALKLPQSTCSHHLGVLRRAGLVRDRRDTGDARSAVAVTLGGAKQPAIIVSRCDGPVLLFTSTSTKK